MQIRSAKAIDCDAVSRLLEQANLLTDDLDDQLTHFVVANKAENIIATGGLDVFDSFALLRSVAVASEEQGKNLGSEIVTKLLELATELGLHQLYLLTTSAAGFFADRGFTVIDRNQVPHVIAATAQFSQLCPASATVMRLDLTNGTGVHKN